MIQLLFGLHHDGICNIMCGWFNKITQTYCCSINIHARMEAPPPAPIVHLTGQTGMDCLEDIFLANTPDIRLPNSVNNETGVALIPKPFDCLLFVCPAWCGHCKRMFPAIEEAARRLEDCLQVLVTDLNYPEDAPQLGLVRTTLTNCLQMLGVPHWAYVKVSAANDVYVVPAPSKQERTAEALVEFAETSLGRVRDGEVQPINVLEAPAPVRRPMDMLPMPDDHMHTN